MRREKGGKRSNNLYLRRDTNEEIKNILCELIERKLKYIEWIDLINSKISENQIQLSKLGFKKKTIT